MIRRSVLNINSANKGKIDSLSTLCLEMTKVINLYIDELWAKEDFSSKFVDFKVDSWLSARLMQCLGKQALEIVKSQRKKKKKTKPTFGGSAFSLDSRFVDFQYDENSFDIWIRLKSLGDKLQLKLPANKHKHYSKFRDWNKNKSVRLINRHGSFYVEVFFEKSEPAKRLRGATIGVDIGYKSLLISSENKTYDTGLEKVYEKISRKEQGSRAFKRALTERNNKINESMNRLDLSGTMEVVCEDLKNVKKNSKGKMRKRFMNKLQRWSYVKVLDKLSQLTEEAGVILTRINPAYTSQKCSKCGVIDKKNRKGKTYRCACGLEIDADYNASINISHMGVYSPYALC